MNKTNSQKTIRPSKLWHNWQVSFLKALDDPWINYLAHIQNLFNIYTVQFYKQKNISTLHLPITTGSISSPLGLGSDSIPVRVNLCGIDTYLADSMQFMLEFGCRIFAQGCYYIMPSFRGEKADERHLCQFYHSEAEIPGTLSDVMNLVEDYLRYICSNIINDYSKELTKICGDLRHIEKLLNQTIKRIAFDDAVKMLNDDPMYVTHSPEGFSVINSSGEKLLIEKSGGFCWITNFDYISVPFYQAKNPKNPQIAINADLLFGIGEVVGAGERHENYFDVLEALNDRNIKECEYQWYLDMKKTFPLKTSGFGLGVERFLLWLLKHNDIRDCQILPRFNGINMIP